MKAGAPKSRKPLWRRWSHALVRMVRGVVMLHDTPQRIALGSGIGMFFAFQPFVGSQTVAAAITAKLLRANVLASIPWAWITNPLTIAPIYYALYRLGALFFPGQKTVDYERISHIGEQLTTQSWGESLAMCWRLLMSIALPIEIGGTIVGVIVGMLGFGLIQKAVNAVQTRRLSRRNRWFATLVTLPPVKTP